MGDAREGGSRQRMPWHTATIATVRSLYTIRPAVDPRWPVALQGAISIAVPIAVLTLFGESQLGYQAATGAFTALHVARLRPRERAKVLPFVAAALVGAAALGVVLGSLSTAWTLIGLAVLTAAAAAFVYGFGLGAPGPLFFVLVYGVAAHVAGVVPGFAPGGFLAAVAAGCAFSYLVALAPLVLPRVRAEGARPLRELMPRPAGDDAAVTLFARATAVGVVGAAAGILVDPDRAYWIVSAGVAVVGIAVERRVAVSRGIHRVLGTVAGAGLYFVLILVPWTALWLAALLGALQFAVEMLVVRHYALALLFITPLVLLLTGAATGGVGSPAVAGERVIDTAVGSVLGMLAVLIPRLGRQGAERTQS